MEIFYTPLNRDPSISFSARRLKGALVVATRCRAAVGCGFRTYATSFYYTLITPPRFTIL